MNICFDCGEYRDCEETKCRKLLCDECSDEHECPLCDETEEK